MIDLGGVLIKKNYAFVPESDRRKVILLVKTNLLLVKTNLDTRGDQYLLQIPSKFIRN